jgi:hypothetical protein
MLLLDLLIGRVAECWEGACMEFSKRIADGGRNVVNRGGMFVIFIYLYI